MKDHPLFPPKDENDAHGPEVAMVNVTRFDSRKGKYLWCRVNFPPEAIQDLEQVYELFGGGDYELIAKLANGRVSSRQKYEMPGAPKPLNEDEGEIDQAETAVSPMPAGVPTTEGGLLGMAMMMIRETREAASSAQNHLVTMMNTMMNQDRENSRQFVTMMQTQANQALQSQGQLMNTTLEIMRNAKPEPAEGVIRGIEMGVEMVRGQTEANAAAQGAPEPTLPEVLAGVKAVADAIGPQAGNGQTATAVPRNGNAQQPRPPGPPAQPHSRPQVPQV